MKQQSDIKQVNVIRYSVRILSIKFKLMEKINVSCYDKTVNTVASLYTIDIF